jgi:glutamine amidotransferase
MQVLFESTAEGECQGLGILKGNVEKLPFTPNPHMGWASLQSGTYEGDYFYFVHSYGVMKSSPHQEVSWANAHIPFIAMVKERNYTGVQFHPERSGAAGHKLLKDFLC